MNSIKMDRLVLLGHVRDNLKKHQADYIESVEDYKAAVLKMSTANLKLAKSGDLEQFKEIKSVPQPPRSYEKEYTRAMRMLELSVDSIIEVEEDIFNQLVLDEWAWKNSFIGSSVLYKSLT